MKAIYPNYLSNDITELQSDDPVVFGRFVKKHQKLVFSLLGRMGFSQADAEDLWSTIPTDTDVLITHGPPYGIFDLCPGEKGIPEHAGCPALWSAVEKILSIKLHVFGHIHEGYGVLEHAGGRTSVNAAMVYRGLRRTPVDFTIQK